MVEAVTVFVSSYSYLAVFVFLFSLSFAVPVSEEAALIIIGYLTREGVIALPYSIIVTFMGVAAGDLFLFFLGRFAGEYIAELKIVRRLFKKENIEKGELFIEENGPRVVFISRFIIGVRASMMIASGSLKMRLRDFILYDFLAMLIFIPVLFFSGYLLAHRLQSGISVANKAGIVLLIIFSIVIVLIIAKKYWLKKYGDTA